MKSSWFSLRAARLVGLALGLVMGLVMAGCSPEGRGFNLPEGDVEHGKATFVTLGCNYCHNVADIERVTDAPDDLNVRLGGPVARVQTYGELVTSIINPSHKIATGYPPQPVNVDGKSAMRTYNNIMTIQQLVDLVTFLQDEYEIRTPHSYR